MKHGDGSLVSGNKRSAPAFLEKEMGKRDRSHFPPEW